MLFETKSGSLAVETSDSLLPKMKSVVFVGRNGRKFERYFNLFMKIYYFQDGSGFIFLPLHNNGVTLKFV